MPTVYLAYNYVQGMMPGILPLEHMGINFNISRRSADLSLVCATSVYVAWVDRQKVDSTMTVVHGSVKAYPIVYRSPLV
jgi:hypothetical protein